MAAMHPYLSEPASQRTLGEARRVGADMATVRLAMFPDRRWQARLAVNRSRIAGHGCFAIGLKPVAAADATALTAPFSNPPSVGVGRNSASRL